MDFRFSEDQLALRALAREILTKEVTPERLKRAERDGHGFDARLWDTLAEAGLLGIGVPEAHGGAGLGLLELGLLLVELGRALAPVPALPTLVLGALPIAAFGSDAQRERWLGAVARGEARLAAALPAAAAVLPIQARREGAAWRLDGVAPDVPGGQLASRILVPARGADAVEWFLVDPAVAGTSLAAARTSTGEPRCGLTLAGVLVPDAERLPGAAERGALGWLHERALVALAAQQLGVCERALEITAAYVTQREQFGVPIGSFQAVQHRAADAYVDLECLRWTTWRAAWRLAEGLPAAREAAVAKFWAADAGARILASAQHLHGGIGVDRDYPIHRYFLRARQLELALGAATPQLVWLGRELARSGPGERA